MLWWLQADLRSVGPPTSKMHLQPDHRSTCYECFNATVRSFFSLELASIPVADTRAEKNIGNTVA